MTTRKIGGSDIAKIMGESPYGGPFSAWLRIVKGQSGPGSDVKTRGNDFEPVIRNMFVRESGLAMKPKDIELRHEASFVGGTPDDITTGNDVVEYKTSSPRARHHDDWGDAGSPDIPKHYALQCAWYMMLANAPQAHVGVLFSLDDFRIYRIKRDVKLEERMFDAAGRFWVNHIVTEKPPEPDETVEAKKYVQSAQERVTIVTADRLLNQWVSRYKSAKAAYEVAEKEVDLCKNNIHHELNGATAAVGDGWKLSNNTVTRAGGVEWEAIARKHCPAEKINDEVDNNRKAQTIYKQLTVRKWTNQ